MNDRQIRIFKAVAEAGSFSGAEETLHITKQAMLKQMSQLENEIGVRLLVRKRSGTTLTPAGELFRKGILKIDREMEKLLITCREAAGDTRVLRVGNVEHQVLLLPVTQVFSTRWPDVQIRQVIHPNHSGEWRVANDVQDVAETFAKAYADNPYIRQSCGYKRLTDVPYVAAMRTGHPLAGKRKVSLPDLARQQTMVFPIMLEEEYNARIEAAFAARPENLIRRSDVDHQVEASYECIESDRVMITANPFIEGISELLKIPLDTGWKREYGILYRRPASELVMRYVETAEEVYGV